MIEMVWLTSVLLGLGVGVILGLTGAGGAIIGVPVLVFGLHLQVAQAAPIALTAVGLAAALGALLGLRAKILRYRAAGLIAITGMVISPLGLWTARQLPNEPLALLFAGVLASVAIQMWRRSRLTQSAQALNASPPPCLLNAATGRLRWTAPCARALMGTGALAGFLSGLLGVGGGFVIVPALRRITDLPMQNIVATSLGVIALVSATGVMAATLGGHLNLMIAVPFTAGVVMGMLAGRRVAGRFTPQRIQQSFALFAMIVAVALFIKASIAWLN